MWSGIWADLAAAPTSSSSPIATATPSLVVNSSGARSKICSRSKVPSSRKMNSAAITSPTSPTTLMTNAFIPAFVAVLRRYQKLISA